MGCRLQLNLSNKYRAFLCRHLACIWWSIREASEIRVVVVPQYRLTVIANGLMRSSVKSLMVQGSIFDAFT